MKPTPGRRYKWSKAKVLKVLEFEKRMPIARDRAGKPIDPKPEKA